MKLWEIFRFEIGYQGRRIWTWLYFAALFALSFRIATEGYVENARAGGYAFNGSYVIVSITLLGSAMALLVTAAFAGDAGARDVQTRMHPLVYTSPIGKRNREFTFRRLHFDGERNYLNFRNTHPKPQ